MIHLEDELKFMNASNSLKKEKKIHFHFSLSVALFWFLVLMTSTSDNELDRNTCMYLCDGNP